MSNLSPVQNIIGPQYEDCVLTAKCCVTCMHAAKKATATLLLISCPKHARTSHDQLMICMSYGQTAGGQGSPPPVGDKTFFC